AGPEVQVPGQRQDADRPDAAGAEAVDVADTEPGIGERAARALGVDLVLCQVGRGARRGLEDARHRGPAPDAHRSPAAKPPTRRLKASACSSGAWWPAAAITSRRAPGMPCASSSDSAGGVT